jgi:hypothetical protein
VLRCRASGRVRLLDDWEIDREATEQARQRLVLQHKECVLAMAPKDTFSNGRHLCFAAGQTLRDLEVAPGDAVELLNLAGAPLRLWVDQDDSVAVSTVAVDDVALQVLGAAIGDRRRVRRLRIGRC